jgi:hypothetical protein
LFAPDPHVVITAIAKGANEHVGNGETMECWDRYRGGLEFLTSFAQEYQSGLNLDADALAGALTSFTRERMSVALRLQMSAKQWANAYHLDRRLLSYRTDVLGKDVRAMLNRMATIDTARNEAKLLGARVMVFDDSISDETLATLADDPEISHIRASALSPADGRRRAFLTTGDAPGDLMRTDDISVSLVALFDRFHPG